MQPLLDFALSDCEVNCCHFQQYQSLFGLVYLYFYVRLQL